MRMLRRILLVAIFSSTICGVLCTANIEHNVEETQEVVVDSNFESYIKESRTKRDISIDGSALNQPLKVMTFNIRNYYSGGMTHGRDLQIIRVITILLIKGGVVQAHY